MQNVSKRGFIFSLDAFIAFTLALVAIYTMIFFSSIPSAYYNSLTQAHYLAKDSLLSLSQTHCDPTVYNPQFCNQYGDSTILEYLAFTSIDKPGNFRFYLDRMIPEQYGYTVKMSDSTGQLVQEYSTTATPTPPDLTNRHKKHQDKLSASAHMLVFQYNRVVTPPENPYRYITCQGTANLPICSIPVSDYEVPTPQTAVVELIVFT